MIQKFIQFVKNAFGKDETTKKPTAKPRNQRDSQKSNRPRKRRPEGRDQQETKRPPKKRWDVSQFKVEPEEGKKRFHDLNLPNGIMHAVADLDFKYCTPIQAEVLGSTLSGRDATGQAQTGTGKTAAFLITIFARLMRNRPKDKPKPGVPRALILAPTRELVQQIYKDAQGLGKYTGLKVQTIYGGMDFRKQQKKLTERPVDVVVATPGRLLDFAGRKMIDFRKVEILVIDEADRMLDMGFIPDVKKIVYKTPPKDKRQTLFFSATMTGDVERLSNSWTRDAVRVVIEPEHVAADSVDQVIYIVTTDEKFALLYNIITRKKLTRVLIFCNRRDETRRLTEKLRRYNISSKMLSGDVPQKKRFRTLEDFKAGKFQVLVATDVAGRGIHIESMDHVINYTLPNDPEDYVHRIGRTGRAGESGTSISFACEEGSFQLPAIIEYLGRELPSTFPDEEWLELPPPPKRTVQPGENDDLKPEGDRRRSRSGNRNRRPRRSGGNNRNRSRSPQQQSNASDNKPAADNANAGNNSGDSKPTQRPRRTRRPATKKKSTSTSKDGDNAKKD